jgi:HAD superfamily hydrolase (TIGR01509 family)
MLEAVLFDGDGVLFDSEELYFRSVQQTFRQFGIEIGKDEYIRRYMIEQTSSEGIVRDYHLEARGITIERVLEVKEAIVLKSFDEELKMMTDAMELLEAMRRIFPDKLALVSCSYREEVERKLKKFSLTDMFKVVISANDIGTNRRKPFPDAYLKAVELLKIQAGNAVAIEDTPSGCESAYRAGCRVIAYPNRFTENMEFPYANVIVKSLKDISCRLLAELYR